MKEKEIELEVVLSGYFRLNGEGDYKIGDELLAILYENPHITKIKESVVEAFYNMKYDDMIVVGQYYDMKNDRIKLRLREYKICPRCGRDYWEYPAISRKDNKTEICPRCGTEEALDDFFYKE